MSLEHIIGQEKAIRLIRMAIGHERIPHAWLFSGMAHIGKFKAAVALAQMLVPMWRRRLILLGVVVVMEE